MPKEYPGWFPAGNDAIDNGRKSSTIVPEIIFDGISTKEKVLWRSALAMVYLSVPEDERQVVPPFCLHRTLLKAMTETFNCDLKKFDRTAEEYLRDKIWAFAYMDGAELRNLKLSSGGYRRIVLMLDRVTLVPEAMSVEFTILHEIGHFVIRFIRGVKLTAKNVPTVEFEADLYAFGAYARLLHKFPQYRTVSPTRKQVDFEDFMKGLVRQTCGRRATVSDKVYEMIAEQVVEELKWKEMYGRMYGRQP